jgi:hypothetical protein
MTTSKMNKKNILATLIVSAAIFAGPGVVFGQTASLTADIRANGADGSVSVPYGSAVTVSWSSTNASQCSTVSGSVYSNTTQGSVSIMATAPSMTFTLTCTGSTGGTVSDSVTVNATLAAVADIKVNGSDSGISVAYGDLITLTWTSQGATTCSVDPISYYAISDSKSIRSISTQTYTLTCQGPNGVSARDSVTVTTSNAPSTSTTGTTNYGTTGYTYTPTTGTGKEVTISASPQRIDPRGNSVLVWNTQNMDSCTASGGWSGTKPTSGSETVFPNGSTEYILTCYNGSRSVRSSVIVYVGTTAVTSGTVTQGGPFTVQARNLTTAVTQFSDTVRAQSLDNVEFEVRISGGATGLTQMRLSTPLPADLFYLPASSKIAGVAIPDGIADANGIFVGDIAANQTKVITFTAVVFYGVAQKTIPVSVVAKGSSNLSDTADVIIESRGQVLGASTVVTGPEHIVLWVIFFGFLAASVLYLFLYNRRMRMAGQNVKFHSTIAALRAVERRPDV